MATGEDDPKTLADALAAEGSPDRSNDGTILPKTHLPDTGDGALIAALPRLSSEGPASDLAVLSTLGEGGMGIVRLAHQAAVGREVAVKCLRPEVDDDRFALALLREAWVTGSLEHPNIVPIYWVGLDANDRPLIVMKRIEGTPWSELIRDESKTLRDHLRILSQVSRAVEFAGSRGIVHRDLKPDNVMIGAFDEVYVVDWGIAVSLRDDHGGRISLASDATGICGTPGYMAPEMVRTNGDQLCVQTDVYALGTILHELITKERRHRGGDLQAVLLSTMESTPVEYAPHVPLELAAIANRSMHHDIDARFETAGALRGAIDEFIAHESARQLIDQGEQRLAAWAELNATEATVRPIDVQRLADEARFAFIEALRQWPDSVRAQGGLLSTLERKFEHDVSRDDFESAALVLDEIGERRPDHEQRLDELRARMEQRRAELTQLRALQSERNLDVGRRTRAFLMLILAVGFSSIPLAAGFAKLQGTDIGYQYFYAMSAVKIVGALMLVVWARESLGKTEVNRQLTAAVFLIIFMEFGFRPFAQRLGHPIEHALFVDFGIYALVTATLAITVDRRLIVCPIIYITASALTYFHVDSVLWYLGGAHATFGLVAAAIWRPDQIIDPERAAARS